MFYRSPRPQPTTSLCYPKNTILLVVSHITVSTTYVSNFNTRAPSLASVIPVHKALSRRLIPARGSFLVLIQMFGVLSRHFIPMPEVLSWWHTDVRGSFSTSRTVARGSSHTKRLDQTVVKYEYAFCPWGPHRLRALSLQTKFLWTSINSLWKNLVCTTPRSMSPYFWPVCRSNTVLLVVLALSFRVQDFVEGFVAAAVVVLNTMWVIESSFYVSELYTELDSSKNATWKSPSEEYCSKWLLLVFRHLNFVASSEAIDRQRWPTISLDNQDVIR